MISTAHAAKETQYRNDGSGPDARINPALYIL
jgi:hypothetical protein